MNTTMMNATNGQKPALNHDAIARLAMQIWQTEGGQEGRDLEYWLRAERQLLAASKPAAPAGSRPANLRKQVSRN